MELRRWLKDLRVVRARRRGDARRARVRRRHAGARSSALLELVRGSAGTAPADQRLGAARVRPTATDHDGVDRGAAGALAEARGARDTRAAAMSSAPAVARGAPRCSSLLAPAAGGPREVVNRIVATVDGEPITAHEVRRYARGAAARDERPPRRSSLEALITDKLLEKEIAAQGIARQGRRDRPLHRPRCRQRNGIDDDAASSRRSRRRASRSRRTGRKVKARDREGAAREPRDPRSASTCRRRRSSATTTRTSDEYAIAERREGARHPLRASTRAPTRHEVARGRGQGRGGARAGGRRRATSARWRSSSRRDRAPTRAGVLGTFARGEMEPALDEVVFALKPGEVSEPVRAPRGLPPPARRRARRRRAPAARRGAGRDPRDALQRGPRGALPGLALAGPARAAPRRGAQLNPAIFREYDIRGIAERDFDAAFARGLGRAFGTLAAERGARRGERRPRLPAHVGRATPRRSREGIRCDRARRGRHRRVPDAAHVLLALPLGPRRRHPGHRQPQPGRLQRLQALPRQARRCTASRSRTCAVGIEAGDVPAAAPGGVEPRGRRPRYQDYVVENVGRLARADPTSSSTRATAPAARWRRRSTGASARAVTDALLRHGRPLPEPPSRSDGRREHAAR